MSYDTAVTVSFIGSILFLSVLVRGPLRQAGRGVRRLIGFVIMFVAFGISVACVSAMELVGLVK